MARARQIKKKRAFVHSEQRTGREGWEEDRLAHARPPQTPALGARRSEGRAARPQRGPGGLSTAAWTAHSPAVPRRPASGT